MTPTNRKGRKGGLASYYLKRNAQEWFLQLEAAFPNLTWEDFKHHYHLQFGPPINSHKLKELFKLRQQGSVAKYQEKFKQLAYWVGTLTQEQKIELYISRLVDYN